MKIEDVRKLYYTEPFKPFAFILRDGTRVSVGRRLWMAIAPEQESVWVFSSTGRLQPVELKHIDRVEFKRRASRRSKDQVNHRRRKTG